VFDPQVQEVHQQLSSQLVQLVVSFAGVVVAGSSMRILFYVCAEAKSSAIVPLTHEVGIENKVKKNGNRGKNEIRDERLSEKEREQRKV
jgi:hypothetical protein